MDFLNFIIDVLLHIDVHLAGLLANYGLWLYAILFIIVFCETGLVATPFLPGDALLFAAGALASLPTNHLSVHWLFLLLTTAAIIGDAVNYTIGKFFGKQLFSNPKSKIFKQKYLEQTHTFYEKYGGKTIIIARFVPIVRTFAPFVAGMGHMTYHRFFLFNVVGGIAWTLLLLYGGFFFGGFETVQNNLTFVFIGIILLSNIPIVIEFVRGKQKAKKTDLTNS